MFSIMPWSLHSWGKKPDNPVGTDNVTDIGSHMILCEALRKKWCYRA